MGDIPAWAIPTETNDHKEARNGYLRSEIQRRSDVRLRQAYRRLRVEEIGAAAVETNDGHTTILGGPWMDAWITVAAFLAVAGRFGEILPPREWLAKKISEGLV